MSLPTPNLDDRKWEDLRLEALALISRYAPKWTDYNAHDPGVTLLEELAYRTELELFRMNQITAAHQAAFLGVFGNPFEPRGTRPAVGLLVFDGGLANQPVRSSVVEGEYFTTVGSSSSLADTDRLGRVVVRSALGATSKYANSRPKHKYVPDQNPTPDFGFRAMHKLSLTGVRLAAVQSFDGRTFQNLTERLKRSLPSFPWGEDPVEAVGAIDTQAALYVGLDLKQLGSAADLTLWFVPVDTWPRTKPVPDDATGSSVCSERQNVQVVWEYLNGCKWRPLPRHPEFLDETACLTLAGRVIIPAAAFPPPNAREGNVIGDVAASAFYIRCRLASGRPDAAPQLIGIFADAVRVKQWDTALTMLYNTVSPNVKKVAPKLFDLQLSEKISVEIQDLYDKLLNRGWTGIPIWSDWPTTDAMVDIEFNPRTSAPNVSDPCVSFVVLGVGTGEPCQNFDLPCPIDRTQFLESSDDPQPESPRVIVESLRIWTMEPSWSWSPPGAQETKWVRKNWGLITDFFLAGRTTAGFVFDPNQNRLQFGDGEHGRVTPMGAVVLASYRWTFAELANNPPGTVWRRIADRDRFRPGDVPIPFRNVLPVTGGKPAEGMPQALFRLEADVAAGEQLVELAGTGTLETLDGLPPLPSELPRPGMAVTPLDFEYLARTVPGTVVLRARAWRDVDPRFPGVEAQGAVTIVVVPGLPADKPEPTQELLKAVAADLSGRRPVTCRVFVIGPKYQPVGIKATLSVRTGQGSVVLARATKKLQNLFHPIHGGSKEYGWPFGRSVYPGELLQLLSSVDGVLHVTLLRLSKGDGVWGEDPISVEQRALVSLVTTELDMREES